MPAFIIKLLLSLSPAILIDCKKNLSKHPKVLLISYDGFRHDYLDKVDTPNLNKIKNSGVSVPYIRNQFVTQTFPNHMSIATGLFVESHGITANVLFDPLYNRTLNGKLDEPEFWNYSPDVVPIWVANELAGNGRISAVSMWPGVAAIVGPNNTRATYARPFKSGVQFEDRVDEAITWLTNETSPANLICMYFEEPDATGHANGPNSPEIIQQIQRMDNLTGYLISKLEKLGILNELNLILLSDHGLAEINPNKTIDIRSVITKEFSQHGANPVLQLLPKNDNDTLEILGAFKTFASTNGNFDAYLTNETMFKLDWHYAKNRRIMPILLVAHLGWQFQTSDKLPKSRGMHGYDNEYLEMRPFFMAKGPAFKSNYSGQPFSNVDVYSMISKILNFKPPPHNGSFVRVQELLNSGQPSMETVALKQFSFVSLIGIIVGIFLTITALIIASQKRKRRNRIVPLVHVSNDN